MWSQTTLTLHHFWHHQSVLHNTSVRFQKGKLIEHLLDTWGGLQGVLVYWLLKDALNSIMWSSQDHLPHKHMMLLRAHERRLHLSVSAKIQLNSKNWKKGNKSRRSIRLQDVIDEGVCHYSHCNSQTIDPSIYPGAKSTRLSCSNFRLLFPSLMVTIKPWIPSELCWFFSSQFFQITLKFFAYFCRLHSRWKTKA